MAPAPTCEGIDFDSFETCWADDISAEALDGSYVSILRYLARWLLARRYNMAVLLWSCMNVIEYILLLLTYSKTLRTAMRGADNCLKITQKCVQ